MVPPRPQPAPCWTSPRLASPSAGRAPRLRTSRRHLVEYRRLRVVLHHLLHVRCDPFVLKQAHEVQRQVDSSRNARGSDYVAIMHPANALFHVHIAERLEFVNGAPMRSRGAAAEEPRPVQDHCPGANGGHPGGALTGLTDIAYEPRVVHGL